MTFYRTSSYGTYIHPVGVIKVTEKTVTFIRSGTALPTRVNKVGEYERYHGSFQEARNHLLTTSLCRIEGLRQRIAIEEKNLAAINALTEPTTTTPSDV